MRCGNCGQPRLEAERKFCGNCGKPFSGVAPTLIDDSLSLSPSPPIAYGSAPGIRVLTPPAAMAPVAAPVPHGPPPLSRAIATLLTAPRKEAKRLPFLLRALVAMIVAYGTTAVVGQVAMTYGGEKGVPSPLFLGVGFIANLIVGYVVGRLVTPRTRAKPAIVVVGSLLLLLTFGGRAHAEVPEHNPSLDHQCKEGFHWSRGPVACKQTDCPEGAGRTYTYDCSCGEAWGKPARTCYGTGGLVTKCVAAGAPCDDPGGKLGGVFFGGLGAFILLCGGPITATTVIVAGASMGWGYWLWNRGRPGPLTFGRAQFEAKVRAASENAKKAVDALNAKMRGGLSPEDLQDLGVVYENWLNATPQQKEQLRLELAREGIDVVKLGDALRYAKDGTERAD